MKMPSAISPTASEQSIKQNDMTPMLICDNVQASIAFYEEVLGFNVVHRMNDVGKSGWASLNHGPIQLMLASPTYLPDPVKVEGKHPQALFYFYPEDVEALHTAIVERGYEAGELTVRFYGMKEFEMIDPSGHILIFGQETDEEPVQEG